MDRRSWVMLLVLAAIWGASYMFIKIGLRDLSPAMVAWSRIALAAVVLCAPGRGAAGSSAAWAAGRWSLTLLGRDPGRRAVPADRGRRAGDLLVARGDPGHLGAAVHRAARDLVRPRGALTGAAAGRRHARRDRRGGPARGRPGRLGEPASRRPGGGARRPRLCVGRLHRQAPLLRRAADRRRRVGDGGQHRAAHAAGAGDASGIRAWPRPRGRGRSRWACSAPGSRSRSSTT